MSTCNGCGGVVGRDCYNPQECEWISRDQQARALAREYAQPDDDRISALEAEVSELRAIIAATLPAAPAPTEQAELVDEQELMSLIDRYASKRALHSFIEASRVATSRKGRGPAGAEISAKHDADELRITVAAHVRAARPAPTEAPKEPNAWAVMEGGKIIQLPPTKDICDDWR
jgi:hypothetical protein